MSNEYDIISFMEKEDNNDDLEKQEIERLRRENALLNNRLHTVERRLKTFEAMYQKLANSKLGRLTQWYWRYEDAIKAKLGIKPSVSKPSVYNANAKGDEGFFARMEPKIREMPESNGCRYYERIDKRIAVICDQFYWDSVKDAADFIYIEPDNWQECVKDIDCLLIVSAWQGLGESAKWRGVAHEGTKRRALAYEIIEHCKQRNVPAIFYSKEDPPNYDAFLGLAKKCDFVFTSDDGCVPKYREDCGHDRVWPLHFCINPVYHNPVGLRHQPKEEGVLFAGSWMKKYPERCKDMERMFAGVLAAGRRLHIVDRCYHLRNDGRYRYPAKYLKFQSPAIDHDSLQKVHKLFNWCININTVKDSSTMFANRVYELQANGNLLISNYSRGVSNTFPNVFLIHDQKEVGRILDGFTAEEVYERQMAGVRRVMTGETCYDRVAEMLQVVGLATPPPVRKVLVVATTLNERVQ